MFLRLFQGDDEFGQVAVTLDAAEAFLGLPVRRTQTGPQQRRRTPAHHHLGIRPAFDPARPIRGAGKAAFYQVGRAEAAPEWLAQIEPVQGEGSVLNLQQLQGRGLHGVQFVVSDDHPRLKAAIRQSAAWGVLAAVLCAVSPERPGLSAAQGR